MKSNIQNQRGYALFIVMGLMVLATIGVMATYKAASSYDEKSGTSFKNRGAKEVTEAGTRAVESYLTDRTWDAVGILEQMLIEKLDSNLEVKAVKVPISTMNSANSDWFDVYFTDVNWDDTTQVNPNLLVTMKILGVNDNENKTAQEVLFKVSGLIWEDLGYFKGTPEFINCTPDVAIYLGGGGDVVTTLYVSGGAYAKGHLINNSGGGFQMLEGAVNQGDVSSGDYQINKRLDVPGNFVSANPISFNGTTTELNVGGHAEFLNGFKSVMKDVNVDGDAIIYGGMGTVSSGVKWNIGGNATFKTDGSGNTFSFGGPLEIRIEGDLIIESNITCRSWGGPKIHVGGNVRISPGVTLDIGTTSGQCLGLKMLNLGAGDTRDTIFNMGTITSTARIFSETSVNIINSSVDNLIDWNYSESAVQLEGLTGTNNTKAFDMGVDDTDFLPKMLTWNDAVDLAVAMNVGSITSAVKGKFDVATLNEMSNHSQFVNTYGSNGYLILDIGVLHYGTALSHSVTDPKLEGKVVFVHGTPAYNGQIDWNNVGCFPETSENARVLLWSTSTAGNNAGFCVGDRDDDGDPFGDFYGMILQENLSSNFQMKGNISIHGSIYMKSNNGNPFFGAGVDSIRMEQSVLEDISKVGLVKLDDNGDTLQNCLTGSGIVVTNTVIDSSNYISLDKSLKMASSQLSVSRVGTKSQMDISKMELDMVAQSAEIMKTPYVGFSKSMMTIDSGKYSDLDELMDSTKFRSFYQYEGVRDSSCSGTWGREADDFIGLSDTTIMIPYTVNCGTGSRSVTRNFILQIGNNTVTGSNSSTGNASSSAGVSSVTASSVAASSTAGSSTPLSSSALAVDPSCAIYPLWDPSVSYAKDEYVRGNAGQVYSCVASDLTDCSRVFSSGGSDANGIWFYKGTCTVNLEQDTISWITPVHNREYTLGDVVNFEWYNSTTENVNISFKLDGDANWTTNAYSTRVATSTSGSHSWTFQTGTGEGEGRMYFKIELESTVGVSDVVAVTVKAPTVDICAGVSAYDKTTGWTGSLNDQLTYDGNLYTCIISAYCSIPAGHTPISYSWQKEGACGASSGTSSIATSSLATSSVANSSAAISSVAASSAASACSGYDTFVGGASSPSNGEKYVYDGSLWLAKNNPGTWEVPAEGWFWSKVTTCN